MIYHFKTTVVSGKNTMVKDMYLTAENEKAFYRRASEQYGVNIKNIDILEEIEDETINVNTDRFKKKSVKELPTETPLVSFNTTLAEEMLKGKINGLTEEQVNERTNSGWKCVELIDNIQDLTTCLDRYKKVKLYYLRTGMKKNKKYIVLYK